MNPVVCRDRILRLCLIRLPEKKLAQHPPMTFGCMPASFDYGSAHDEHVCGRSETGRHQTPSHVLSVIIIVCHT
jgi:hypothetical protein